ncbi:DUF5134 domain-containing protein [Promicromonospora panici]|uniref:DUF5134 domain-containing protein n=1 Tax=Promicromonospora panici TaxID=2219658 RepID=UPI002413D3BA|nr:DUF5134 domain-containing protein [Promicromonospora panici]
MAGLFAALSAHSLWRLVAARQASAAAGNLFHLGMNLVMVAMVWPWWVHLPVLPQLVFFVVAAVFHAAIAGWYAVDALTRTGSAGQPRTGRHRNALVQAVHVAMMLAMVWALAAMSPAPGYAHHVDHTVPHAGLDTGATVGGVVLAAILLAGGALFLVHFVRDRRERGMVWWGESADDLAHALMSFGMAAMCGLMLTG